ncbi:MAG: TIGR01777 family oxidoreductase [Sulfuricurvum sp.]|uniref:TIGR01777 family oxidoreductase n=1 Tax=Sulfuricurvum sp. TaxID=2025608 RepID=UPI002633A7F3|nr:TIGR01777 family oxidoreductase [Sulfuricurvum sp.]MDD2829860.1 TIGR01777 family oxidoreductase [Sulfuricurvum sp.]MDD4949227.1 TIGR01777 family oxidoreductase [Sulfuricurvum sp.]
MRIAIAGMSGFVGNTLKKVFEQNGDEVIGLDRHDLNGDVALLSTRLEGCEALINLSGAPIIARWSDSYKQTLRDSRLLTTQKLVDAMAKMSLPPSVFISTSAVGIYPNNGIYDESTQHYADDFLGQLCQEWEQTALKAVAKRIVITRFGIVMGRDGGALAQMLPIFRLGLGGVIGSGEQHFSWIHIDDLTRGFTQIIANETMHGVYNFVAPEPTTNRGLTEALGKALHRPTIFPVPEFALKLLYGEGAKVLTDGQKVIPKRLLNEGFRFEYPNIESAILNLV